MKNPLSEKEFKSVYTKAPRLCVDLIIVKNKKFLLTKRSIKPLTSLWHFPGGTVYYGEKINDAVKRIAKAELGVKVKLMKFINYNVGKSGYRYDVSLVFKCKLANKQTPKPLSQASEVKFFDKIPKNIIKFQKTFLKKNMEQILR